MKIDFTTFLWGWPIIFMAERGTLKFWMVWRVPWKFHHNFFIFFYLHQPPTSVCERSFSAQKLKFGQVFWYSQKVWYCTRFVCTHQSTIFMLNLNMAMNNWMLKLVWNNDNKKLEDYAWIRFVLYWKVYICAFTKAFIQWIKSSFIGVLLFIYLLIFLLTFSTITKVRQTTFRTFV